MGESNGREPLFSDALPLINSALKQLRPGQVIKIEDMPLTQIMSAAEIMDPRTDSYLAHSNQSNTKNISNDFNPRLELLPQELLWIIDQLFRLEITFLDGHPLISTLFTCQYIRPDALAALSSHSSPTLTEGTKKDEDREPGLRNVVLRAMLLATIKCAEIVWDETCKGNVYEHEDVHLSLFGLSFESLLASAYPPPPPSPLRVDPTTEPELLVVGVDDVLEALDVAQNWLVDKMDESPIRQALLGRIALKMEFLYVVALLTSPPHTSATQLLTHYSRIRPLISPLTTFAHISPSPTDPLSAIFNPAAGIPLPSFQPIRETPIFELQESWARLASLIGEMESSALIWEAWNEGSGWPAVRQFYLYLGRREASPYARSIHQSITFSSRTLFASSPPITLVSSFFHTISGVPISIWSTLVATRDSEKTWNSPARKILGWADRVCLVLTGALSASCQNRARSWRLVVKNRGSTFQLVDELKEIVPLMQSVLPASTPFNSFEPALVALLYSQLLEVLLSGFEMDLYESDEWVRVWWVIERLAVRLEELWAALSAPGRDYVQAKWFEARVIRSMAAASILTSSLTPVKPIKRVSPLLDFEKPGVMDRARFQRRFKWLQGRFGNQEDLCTIPDWEEFSIEMEQLAGLPSDQVVQRASEAYRDAVGSLTGLATIPLPSRGGQIRPEHSVRWIAALRRTCFANQNALGTFASTDAQAEPNLRWDSPWFPVKEWSR
ncbi:hypothetical protein T439DRAFT_322835 [Meredithblackwellia eburnea MCA 4105]